jgi:MFS family permease
VVVEGAINSSNSVVEFATMLAIGIVLSIFGIGFLCWLMFNLAVYALPFFAGMTAGLAAYHSGAGILGGLIVGFTAGAITLVVGQAIFATFASPVLRGLIALLFAAPAVVAGYHATLALARIGVPAEGWREAFAIVGAIAIGANAVVRVAAMVFPSDVSRGSVTMSGQSQMAPTPRIF